MSNWISLTEEQHETESCLYKLCYGKKYIVVKGKTLAGSVYLIEKGYAYFIAGGDHGEGHKEGDGKNTFYHKFYQYIKDNPGLVFRLEVVLETNNGYQLLKNEQIELNKAFYDKNLLNNNLTAYLPKYRQQTGSYGWISRAHVLNFRKFQKSL